MSCQLSGGTSLDGVSQVYAARERGVALPPTGKRMRSPANAEREVWRAESGAGMS